MAKPLTTEDRRCIAEKIMDVGNAALVGMAGSQLISGGNLVLLVLGLVLAVEAYCIALVILRGGEL